MEVQSPARIDDGPLDAVVLVLDRDGHHGATLAGVATCAQMDSEQVESAFGDLGRLFLAIVDRFLIWQMHRDRVLIELWIAASRDPEELAVMAAADLHGMTRAA